MLQLCEARIDSCLSKNNFGPQQVYALILCNVIYHYMPFRTLCFIEYQGPCSIDLNLGQSDNCISESTVHRLSDDALFVHHEFPAACVIEKDVKVNIMLQFELYVLSNFKALVAET